MMQRSFCRIVLTVLGLLCCAKLAFPAAPPPPAQRLNELNRQMVEAAYEGRFEEALRLASESIALRKRWHREGHWETANARLVVERWQRLARLPKKKQEQVGNSLILGRKATALYEGGLYREAEKIYREALRIRVEVLGEDHPDTAQGQHNLASCLLAQGRFAPAQSLFRKVLVIRRKRLGGKHPHTALTCGNLASCLLALGRYADALPLLQESLAINKAALGEEHPDTARSCNNLAWCVKALGKPADAVPLYEAALRIRRAAHGELYPDTAQSYGNLAATLYALGKESQALPLFRTALRLYIEVLGEEHPDTASAYSNLTTCLLRQENLDSALPLLEKVLAIRRRTVGEDHPLTALAYRGVAECLAARGKHAEALLLYQKMLAIQRRVLGEDHPHTAIGYADTAACLHARARYGEALPLLEKAVVICRKVHGEEHAETARAYNNLAACLREQGKYADALALAEKALAIRRATAGEEDIDTASSYNTVAACLADLGKYTLALPVFQKALLIKRKIVGEKHPATARAYNNLAFCFNALEKYQEALPLFRKALAIHLSVLGEKHADTAIAHNNVGFCLAHQEKYADALPAYQKALAIRRETLGEEHPETGFCYNSVACCLYRQGRHREAIRSWQAALAGNEAGRLASGSGGFERSLFGERIPAPRMALAVAHAQRKEPLAAWKYAEADLARGLLDDLAGADATEESIKARLRRLDERLLPLFGQALSDDEKKLREELGRQRREVLRQQSKHATQRADTNVWPLERIQKQIPADGALLLWIDVLDDHFACVVRRQGSPRWQRLKGTGSRGAWTTEDNLLSLRLYQALATIKESTATRDRLIQAVRKQCLDPLRSLLGKQGGLPAVRKLFVVPTRRMALVPVEVLVPEYTISYIPSGTVFARTREKHRPLSSASLLALGDPVFTVPPRVLPDPPRHGLPIRAVQPGGNAARAGIRSGDILLRYRGADLHSVDGLAPLIEQEDKAVVVCWRNGQSKRLTLDPGALAVEFDPRSPRAFLRAAWRAEKPATAVETFAPLPGTRGEVEALRALVGPARTTCLLGSLASEQQLDRLSQAGGLKRFRLLHFATHGVIESTPGRSALILARDTLPDPSAQASTGRKVYSGRLTAQAILRGWDLDADLVVLSACETALGRNSGSNGLVGFAHVFLARGARSVVLSRWPADDRATALLMVRFYENLLGKRRGIEPMPRAQALREAKAWLRGLSRKDADRLGRVLAAGELQSSDGKRGKVVSLRPVAKKPSPLPEGDRPFAHPFYWAAFVLVGDPD